MILKSNPPPPKVVTFSLSQQQTQEHNLSATLVNARSRPSCKQPYLEITTHFLTFLDYLTHLGREYIVYLIPQEGIYSLLREFYDTSKSLHPNDAHGYLPHCTLTGFFTLPPALSLEHLKLMLSESMNEAQQSWQQHEKIAKITGMFNDEALGLKMEGSPFLSSFLQIFAHKFKEHLTVEQQGILRIKQLFHISLAYGDNVSREISPSLFELADQMQIAERAKQLSSCQSWQMGLYAREKGQAPEEWMREPLWSVEFR